MTIGIVLAALGAVGCTFVVPAPAAGASPPAGPDRIAFTSWPTPGQGSPTLWTGNIDGSDMQPVGDQHGFFPAWSPDRTHLIFDFSGENGEHDIATVRTDGTGFTQLTQTGYNETPDYSPDGQSIVFGHSDVGEDHPDFTPSLMVMDADGANPRPLMDPVDGGFDYEPKYSPDGTEVVFVRWNLATDMTAVYLVGADGANVRPLTPYANYADHPRWSPDGATIIYNIQYQDDLDDPRNGIWTVPTAGGEPTLLLPTDETLHPSKPDYSPSGDRILFLCFAREDRSEELCVMNADGTNVERLTHTATFENHPVWRATTTEPASTDAESAAFCQAYLDVEVATAPASDADDATVEAALGEFAAAAPSGLHDTVSSVIELAMSGQDDTPEFEAAYGELLGYVATNCGYPALEVTASDYAYEGIPASIDAGPTLLALDNTGAELHHIVVFRVDDGVTDTLEELAEQSHDEPGSKMTPVSSATALPGQIGHALLLLEPGRHVAFCFIPTGATPENLPMIESGELEGAPHYEHGMLAEFDVS